MTILGVDERVQLTPAAGSQYRAVVQIEVVWPDGTSSLASGAMVGRNDVLTAAHVVYDSAHGGYASQIYVYPAHDGVAQPYGFALGVKALANPAYVAGGGFANDI